MHSFSQNLNILARRLGFSKTFNLVATIVIVITLPVTVMLAQQQQNLEQQAQGNEVSQEGFEAQTISVPQSQPGVIHLQPIADASVSSIHSQQNYGSETTLWIDGLLPAETAFLLFDLTQVAGENITSATLRLYVTGGSAGTQIVKRMSDTSWHEQTITYDNRPRTGIILTVNSGGVAGQFIDIDITHAMKTASGGLITIALEQGGKDGLELASKEHANVSYRPQLVVSMR